MAKDGDLPALYRLSLEQLTQIKVVVASKYKQNISDSPGIVSTYSAFEIALFGGRDLGEVLSGMLGFEEFPSLINSMSNGIQPLPFLTSVVEPITMSLLESQGS